MKNRIIYGTSRRKNTDRCLSEVNSFLKNGSGENLYIMVPEQYSSYYEQLLVSRSFENGSFQAEILTFKRLAHRIFTKMLDPMSDYIDNAGKSMLMYTVIDSISSDLKAFRKSSSYPAFAGEAIRAVKEFKRYGLTVNDLNEAAGTADSSLLKAKLTELASLYEEYSLRLTEKGFRDADDDLHELAEEILDFNGFDNSIFWFDAFDGFTPAELEVADAILRTSYAVTFIFCTDSPDSEESSDIFLPVAKTAAKISRMAEKNAVQTEYLACGEIDPVFSGVAGELEHLAKEYFRYPGSEYRDNAGRLRIFEAESIYEETEICALEILKKVREGKLRYGDICVVSGLYEEYRGYMEAVFERYGIPVFLDGKRSVGKHPASLMILSLLDIYIEKYSYESVFSFLKSPYSGFCLDEVSILENYIIEFDIKGVLNWTGEDWTQRPYGDYEGRSLPGINLTRKKLVSLLEPVFEILRYGLDGEEFSRLIFNYLSGREVFSYIKSDAEKAASEDRLDRSDELKQSWNVLMDILDQIKTVAGSTKMTAEKFRQLLEIAFGQKKIGVIPPRTDVVFAGSVGKAVGNNVKMLFLLGANDPGFPESIGPEGLFSDKERNELRESGFEMAPDTTRQVFDRQLDVYNLLNLPKDYLYASWSQKGNDGSDRKPSGFIERLIDLFPDIEPGSAVDYDNDEFIFTPETGISAAIESDDGASPLVRWYRENGYKNLFEEKKDNISTEEFIEGISYKLGNELETSATALEKYISCPFRYFASDILDARERREFSISPPDVGTIIHEILKVLVEDFNGEKETSYGEYVNAALKRFNELHISNIFERDSRHRYLGNRIVKRSVDAYVILRKQIEEGEFTPVDYEAAFGRNKKLGAAEYTAGGVGVILKGRIDRVDAALLKDGEYFRIIDYKSSGRDLKLYRIKEGIEMQLPLYLMAYEKYSGLKPAGMYYFNASQKVLPEDYGFDREKLRDKLISEGRLTGYTLGDAEVIKAMDRNVGKKSSVINAGIGKEEKPTGKLISPDDIKAMAKTVERNIVDNTQGIYSGNYEVSPIRYEGNRACDYCPYNSVCGFNEKLKDCSFREIQTVADRDLKWDEDE